MNQPIILNSMTFAVNERSQELSLSFGMEKTGLVGKNGTGKTSLLEIIVGNRRPASGSVTVNVPYVYLPQDYMFDTDRTIAAAMGVQAKLDAIEKLKEYPGNEDLENIVGLDWDIESRALSELASFGIADASLFKKLRDLSGGERMKVALAGLFINPGRFIILDEPTNNLDRDARHSLYRRIARWESGMIVVSHDRELLDLMDTIVELTEKGVAVYGGNYEEYEKQKNSEREVSLRILATAKQESKKIKKQAQEVHERQQKRTSHAKKNASTQNIPKILLNAMKRSGEETAGMLKTIHEERIESARDKVKKAKERIEDDNHIYVDLSNTEIPKGKLMVEFKEVSYSYSHSSALLSDISFSVYGQDRIGLVGPNGSGKSTVIKLLLKELEPAEGEVFLAAVRYAYLDQSVALLDGSRTLLENVVQISGLDAAAARAWLAGFLFFKKDPFKKVSQLSGGERVRAGLAAVLAGDEPPQLLILDEPTNNLDIDSIKRIESALSQYQGSMLIISHDKKFLDAIGIERYVTIG
jgi:ATPase subunit of ABC transporter with duplicated ATPase domains